MRKRYNLSFRREQQKKERTRRIIAVILIVFVFAVLGTLIYFAMNNIDWSAIKSGSDDKKATEEQKPKTIDITINSVGEVTLYDSQLTAAKDGDKYKFDKAFSDVKKYIDEGDLSLFNLETTFAGSPYRGYPKFNSPDSLAKALAKAGFDVAVTANDHALDSEVDGVESTIDTLKDSGLKAAGTKKDGDDKDYLMTTVSGIKVAVVAYTQETSYNDTNRTLGGNKMSDDAKELINSYSPRLLDDDLKKVESSMKSAKEDGAQVVICYFNWGDNYDKDANDTEKDIAKSLVDMGADMIFASHPHVVQEIETIKNSDGLEVPVFYSLGNFFSGQRTDTIGNRRVEQGMIAQVKFTYNTESNKITKMDYGYLPTWVDKYLDSDTDKNIFAVVPLIGDLDKNEILSKSEHYSGAKTALEDLIEKLGKPLQEATITKGSSDSDSDSNKTSSSDDSKAAADKAAKEKAAKEKAEKEKAEKKKKEAEKKKKEAEKKKKEEQKKDESAEDTNQESDG